MTMKKKVLSFILIIVLCVSVLSGCVLFETDSKADYAQVVARLQNIPIGTGADGKALLYNKDITKYDLLLTYYNSGQQSQTGDAAKQAVEDTLTQMIEKELVIARYYKLVNDGKIVIEEGDYRDFNKAWKAVYEYCDTQIYSIESGLYASKGKTAPGKGETAGEPQYPENTMITKAQKDLQEELDEAYRPEKFTVNPLNIPTSSEADAYKLDAVKRFVIRMIQQAEASGLKPAEEKLLQADKDFINDIINKTAIYEKIMGNGEIDAAKNPTGFFCVRKLLAFSQFDQIKYDHVQKYYNDQSNITDEKIEEYYRDTLEAQKVSFGKDKSGYLNTYFNALKNSDGNTPFVFYNPTSEIFYVKHILVPFSDEQKAAITDAGNGKTPEAQMDYQIQTANQIEAYPHAGRYDDTSKGKYKIQEIFGEVLEKVSKSYYPDNPNIYNVRAERVFNDLIFKYNTDGGIFNNEKGYIMPPKNKGISHGYMDEFAIGAYKLYENYNPGEVLAEFAVTSYGVHIMYYSSHTVEGTVLLSDYTSPLELETYRDAVETYLKSENFDLIKSNISKEYDYTDSEHVTRYEKRYADIVK